MRAPCASASSSRPLPQPEAALVGAGKEGEAAGGACGGEMGRGIVARPEEFELAAFEEREDELMLIVASRRPAGRVGTGQENVVDLKERTRGKTRQHLAVEERDVAARRTPMARI